MTHSVSPVELSGLIFVALALVWAIVLIPMALKHHDEVAKTRSVDKFSDDMRVLARREAVSDRESRLVVGRTPPAAAPPLVEHAASSVVEQRRAARRGAPVETTTHAARRLAARAAAKRRRRILAVLLLADVVVGAGVPLGYFLAWAPAVPVGLTLLFLVVARITVRRDQKRGDRTSAAQRRVEPAPLVEPVETRSPVEPVETTPAAPAARNEQGLTVVTGLDDTSSIPVGLVAELEPTMDAGALWDPLPVTLPTYVTKPRASRSVRTIDLAAAGVSSSGRDAADSALVADAATSQPDADEGRRAVGS